MFQGLTKSIVRQAVDMARPSIVHLLRSPLADGKTFHLVVRHPLTGRILYEETFGNADQETWKYPYKKIARAKSRQGYRLGKKGRKVMTDGPWLIVPGDTRFVGGYVKLHLSIAGSGFVNFYDEAVSRAIWGYIQAICRQQVSQFSQDDPIFFGRKVLSAT